jgi:hypothetical protein
MVGAMALSYSTLELGDVVLGVTLFGSYQVVFGLLHCRIRITNSCANSQDLERFFNTFVVFNLLRELGRYFVNQSGYFLTVAEFLGRSS